MRRLLLSTAAVFALLTGTASAQVFTVIDQAHVRPEAVTKVERAVVAQSAQLQAAWGTPLVSFGPGGWKVYLKIGAQPHGVHLWYGEPYALVWTGGGTVESWSRDFSHEVIETLVNPTTARGVWRDSVGQIVEVADPVEWSGYELDGIYVSDFVLPSWFAGGTTGDPTCQGTICTFPGPVLSPAGDPGPWDQMHVLTGPWQVQSDGSLT